LLAAGAWVKIYPVLVMVPLLSARERRSALLAGFVGGAVAVPLLSAPFLPFDLWVTYFRDVLPAMSARTIVNVYNQSLLAIAARVEVSHDLALGGYDTFWVSWSLRLGGIALGLGGLGLAWRVARAQMLYGVALVLGVICLIAPLGWGHTYVYALPLQWLLARRYPWWVGLCWAAMVVSANHRFGINVPVVWDMVYGRYALAVLLLGYIAVRAVPDQDHRIGGKGGHQ